MNGTPGDDTLIGTTADDNIEGLAGDDNILGLEGNDTLDGGDDDDTVDGGIGDDTITGGSGNDTLIGGRDNDSLDGGTGIDTADYTNALAFVIVDLSVTGAQNTIGAGVDTLLNIENITGSAFNDSLTGTTGANVFTGNDGDDTFVFNNNHAASGDDIRGGDGVDTLRVGDTSSATSYNDLRLVSILDVEVLRLNQSAFPGATNTVDIFSGQFSTFSNVYGDAGDAVTDIIRVHMVNPSSLDLSSTSFNNWGNNDRLEIIGSNGVDIVTLGEANSIVDVGDGNDRVTLSGSDSNDVVFGGNGSDTIVFGIAGGVSFDLGNTASQLIIGNQYVQVSGFENIIGTNYDDVLNGDAGNNVIDGGSGVDQISAGAGDDTIELGYHYNAAAYTIDGGAGVDTLTINSPRFVDSVLDLRGVMTNVERIIYNPSSTHSRSIEVNYSEVADENGDIYFENLAGGVGTAPILRVHMDTTTTFTPTNSQVIFASLIIQGDASAETFHANLSGQYFGGEGDDIFIFGNRIGHFYGDEGIDTVDYSTRTSGIILNSDTDKPFIFRPEVPNANFDVVDTDGFYESFIDASIERIIGTDFADIFNNSHFRETNSFDFIDGRGGDDVINQYGSNFTVLGGTGNDTINLQRAGFNNVIDGGIGQDTLTTASHGYVLSLSTIKSIETIKFVSSSNSTLNADFYLYLNASQFGSGGISSTSAIYGDSYLRNNNIFNVSMDSVTTELDLSGLSFHDWVAGRDYVLVGGDGDSETITTTNFGDVIGSAGGDDTIFALGGDDTVNGDAGNDVISGGFGDDIINGGAGFDAAVYTGGTFSDYTITDNGDGSYTVIAFNGQGTDTLTGIEVIRIDGVDYALSGETFAFTQGDDNVDGTSDDNVMSALGGNDTVHGLDGNDTINGGAGNDLLYGDAGADNLFGGTGNDWFYADVSDTISGGDGYDTISFVDLFAAGVTYNDIGAMGIERVFGTHLDDVLNASSSTVRVDLYGYEGADTLIGGAGNDYIHFDVEDITGGDVQGGAGYDYLLNATPSQLNGAVTIDLGARGFEGYFGSDANEVINAATSSQFATIYSGGGTDTITGSSFNDYVFVVDGNSTVTGGTGFDYIVYNTLDGSGFSFVLGGTGMEGAIGRDGNDSFDASGVATFVTLYGYGGNDTLIGGDGVDAIYGGTGNDTLTGGASQDNFVFYDNWGDDTVTDFADGTDVLIMSVTGLTSFAQLSVIQDGADALISYGGQSIRLTGVTASNLDALNFEFSPPAGSSKPLDQENSVMEDYINALFANSAQHDPMVAFLQDVDRSPPEIINTDDPFETAIFDDSTFDFF